MAIMQSDVVAAEKAWAAKEPKDMAGDSVYFKHYRNVVSTIDFQAIAHRTDVEDISMSASISLNRRADAPKRLSVEGFRRVQTVPEIINLVDRESALLDQLMASHGSVTNARRVGDKVFNDYERVRLDLRNKKATLRAAVFREEYLNFFSISCPTTNHSDCTSTLLVDDTADIVDDVNDVSDPSLAGIEDDESDGVSDLTVLMAQGKVAVDDMNASNTRRRIQQGMSKKLIPPHTVVDKVPIPTSLKSDREGKVWMDGWPIAKIIGDKIEYRPWPFALAAAGSSPENVPNTAERSTAQDKAPARKAFFIPPAVGVGHSPKSNPTTLSAEELPIDKICAKDGGLPPFYVWLHDIQTGNLLAYVARSSDLSKKELDVFWPADFNVSGDAFSSRKTDATTWGPKYDAGGKDDKLLLNMTGWFPGGDNDDEWPSWTECRIPPTHSSCGRVMKSMPKHNRQRNSWPQIIICANVFASAWRVWRTRRTRFDPAMGGAAGRG